MTLWKKEVGSDMGPKMVVTLAKDSILTQLRWPKTHVTRASPPATCVTSVPRRTSLRARREPASSRRLNSAYTRQNAVGLVRFHCSSCCGDALRSCSSVGFSGSGAFE